jgi:site-specific recombinase XerD
MMTQLRQAMIQAMELRQFSKHTQEAYIRSIKQLSIYYKRSPDNITEDEVQAYILYLAKERNLSWNTCNTTVSSVRFFNKAILKKQHDTFYLPFAKKQQCIPDIFTKEEIRLFFDTIKRPKYRALFMTIYSAGLRVSEAVNLTIHDIDSQGGVICVRQGKGKKDRYVPLPIRLLTTLREYWKISKAEHWLFSGFDKTKPYSVRGVQHAFNRIKEKAGITKKVTVHSLRHSFATHMLEAGTNIVSIKQILGYSSINSTLRYTRFSKEIVRHLPSPIENI